MHICETRDESSADNVWADAHPGLLNFRQCQNELRTAWLCEGPLAVVWVTCIVKDHTVRKHPLVDRASPIGHEYVFRFMSSPSDLPVPPSPCLLTVAANSNVSANIRL